MAEKEKKVRNSENAIQRYIRETTGELRKVNWPTRQESINITSLVMVVLVSMSLFLGLIDLIAEKLVTVIISL